jgi:outer membrane receptor protein involved in Fe transport
MHDGAARTRLERGTAMIRVLLATALVCALGAPALAQTATISGTVVDQSGAAVPGATVELIGPGTHPPAISGSRGEYGFNDVRPGTYKIEVTLVGFAPASRSDITVSTSNVEVPAVTLRIASLTDTVVVSATKSDAALIDAPATMSVVTSEVLESTSAQNYGDLLRAVPGVNVVQLSARDVNITSRQSTSSLASTQLVLLDDRSIYLDFLGIVLWDFLPMNMSDIKQIEVVRGPASAVWGANALTGAVNIITKTPRQAPGTTASISFGGFSRDAGSGVGKGMGSIFGANASFAQAPNDKWSYRVSAGYYNSDPYPRPTGTIPVITDPRDPTATVGGAAYPVDGPGTVGTAFENSGTSQPKFSARVDQEINGGRITYEGGVAGTSGIIYSGVGPFDIQKGSVLGYGKVNYRKGGLKVQAFANLADADAPNLLLVDPATRQPLQLNFKTQTYDVEVGDTMRLGEKQVLSVGGNVRQNNFDITIAPAADNRTELGAYVQDEVFLDPVRLTIGGRIDKFGNLPDPVFSPRIAAVFKVLPDQSVRASFNRAFRSPSTIHNFLDIAIVAPADLRPLGIPTPFPLVVHAVGSEIPINGVPQTALQEESLTAYELAYTGTFLSRTTIGAAFYVNDLNDNLNFVQLPNNTDPYTAANPPPGWPLPPVTLTLLAARGIFLPRTGFAYKNLGPLRQKGIELSVDHRLRRGISLSVNYSYQAKPTVLDDPNPFPAAELSLPPSNRFNIGVNADDRRFLGSVSVNYSDNAFWSDVLSSPYFGYTDAYTMLNGSFGVKWSGAKITTLVKGTNLLNKDIQQHIFGDIIKRSVVAEVRFAY